MTGIKPAVAARPVARHARQHAWRYRRLREHPALIALGAPALLPLLFMMPCIVLYNIPTLRQSGNDVLGTGGALVFFAMLAVTPVILLTQNRTLAPLRQWYGIVFAVTIIEDGIIAATDTSFAGGVAGRLTGHTFLLAGVTMVTISIPLLATANRASQKWLGTYWKRVQEYGTYAIWAILVVHLSLLEGFGYNRQDGFGVVHQRLYQIVALSLPLLALRLGPVRRWVRAEQKAGRGWVPWLALAPLLILALTAYAFLANELSFKGMAAFTLNPVND